MIRFLRLSSLVGVLAFAMVAPSATVASGQMTVTASASSQVMCMAAGERASGFNKLCYYNCLGSAHVVTQSAVSLCALSVPAPGQQSQRSAPPQAPAPVRTTCFARGEQTAGMNKICYYDCLGSTRAVTQSAVSLCPLAINQ